MRFMAVSDHQPLSKEAITKQLNTKWCGRAIHLFGEVGSTNAVALDCASQGAEHGTVVVAESQTAGRGREGRIWFSPPYENLYLTILLKRLPEAERSPWIPLLAGLATARAVESLTSQSPSLKWPNDVLLDRHKIGGVLCERASRGALVGGVAVGIGLNVNTSREAFPDFLRGEATSIAAQTGRPWVRDGFVSRILQEFERLYDELLGAEGYSALRDAYVDRCATLGRRVRVITTSERILEGDAVDLGPDGALRIRLLGSEGGGNVPTLDRLVEVRSGDVFHLR